MSLDPAHDQGQENKDLLSPPTLLSPAGVFHWLHPKARRAWEPVILSASQGTELREEGCELVGKDKQKIKSEY